MQVTIQSILYVCHLILNDDDNTHLYRTSSVPDSVLISLHTFTHLNPHHEVYEVGNIMIFLLQVTIEP